jgi:hypothetical protein
MVIERVVDRAMEAGVDGINFQVLWHRPPDRVELHNRRFPDLQVGEGWADGSLMQIDFDVLEDQLRRARSKGFLVNVYPGPSMRRIRAWYTDPVLLLKGQRLKCPWMIAQVFHDGTMRMCDDIVVGDLTREGFWEVWNGPKMVAFRRQLKAAKHFPICAGCCSMFRDRTM